jgi:cytochrome c oxidase cbb3-type subunit 3
MGDETDRLLGHADEADGIEEYDNPLPDWWIGLFFFTVVWGIGYAIDYHFLRPTSQADQYLAQMALAEEQWPAGDPAGELDLSTASVQAGATVFAQTCASCHGVDLSGGIGPNLIDEEWIHGGDPEHVVATITDGVSAKGMPAWGPILGPAKVQQVAAYVIAQRKSP